MKSQCIVKVTTSACTRGDSLVWARSIRTMKRMSEGFDFLRDEISQVGPEIVWNIVNLLKVEDGIYELVTTNEYTNRETGCIEDWDYKLIPVEQLVPTPIQSFGIYDFNTP